jgi:hypothetical protein
MGLGYVGKQTDQHQCKTNDTFCHFLHSCSSVSEKGRVILRKRQSFHKVTALYNTVYIIATENPEFYEKIFHNVLFFILFFDKNSN